MDAIGEIIPFAKEMLNQRPGRSLLKMYMLGSTLAMLGAISGVVEMVLLPFVDQEAVDDQLAELMMEKKKEKVRPLESRTTFICPEVADMPGAGASEAKAKRLATAGRRNSANRLHAS